MAMNIQVVASGVRKQKTMTWMDVEIWSENFMARDHLGNQGTECDRLWRWKLYWL